MEPGANGLNTLSAVSHVVMEVTNSDKDLVATQLQLSEDWFVPEKLPMLSNVLENHAVCEDF